MNFHLSPFTLPSRDEIYMPQEALYTLFRIFKIEIPKLKGSRLH